MVDHRPPSYGPQAPLLNRGPTTAALTGQFFLIPFLNLPHVRPHAVMKLSPRTAFLQAKSALAFDAWFFYYTRAHQKHASIKWHYLHERQLLDNLSPTLPFNLQSRACKKERRERKDIKRRGILVRAAEANIPSAFHPPFFSTYTFPSSVIFLGDFRETVCGG